MTTTYNEPFHVARRFASIDHIGAGRAGWNLVTSQIEDESWNFGRETHVDHAARYERAAEFVDVVTGLWDSWEEDAFVLDKESGHYFDADKLHFLRPQGRAFQRPRPAERHAQPAGPPSHRARPAPPTPGGTWRPGPPTWCSPRSFPIDDAKAFYAEHQGPRRAPRPQPGLQSRSCPA